MKELKTDIITIHNGEIFEGTREEFEKKFFKGKKTTNIQIIRWCEKMNYSLEVNGICFSNP